MDLIIGILPKDGKNRDGKEYHFFEISILPSEKDPRQVGQRSVTALLFDDDELANEIVFKLSEAIKNGVRHLEATKIKSHFANGRQYIDRIDLA